MSLTLSARDHLLLLRTVSLPTDLREKIADSPLLAGHHHLDLTDDDYLALTQHLTLTVRIIRNAKTRRTLARILERLTTQNEARQPDPVSLSAAAAYAPEHIRAVIDELERTVPGWADFSMTDMVKQLAARLPLTGEENARRAIDILGTHHDTVARPMFRGLTTSQIHALLHDDWTDESPGLFLRPENLTPDLVRDTLIISRTITFLDALGEKGTPATKKGNLNRKFVAALVDKFAIPDKELANLHYFNTVLNESDVFLLHELHIWLKLAKLVRLYRGRVTSLKRTRKVLAAGDWSIFYTRLFETVFQVYNLGYRSRLELGAGLQRSLAFSFYQLAELDDGWHDLSATAEQLLLPAVSDQLLLLPWGDVRPSVVARQFLEPLEIFGLVELETKEPTADEQSYPLWGAFRRTELFGRFIGVRWE